MSEELVRRGFAVRIADAEIARSYNEVRGPMYGISFAGYLYQYTIVNRSATSPIHCINEPNQ